MSKQDNTASTSVIEDALAALFDSDTDGLLDAPEKTAKVTSSDRLERSFLEIVEFRREHGRIPSSATREIAERKLGARLDGILANEEKVEALKHLDEFDLLAEPEPPASLDDLLNGDELDLLEDESGILDVSTLPARKSPAEEFHTAKRKKAEDFENFEHLFKAKHRELAEGAVKLAPFPGQQYIVEGSFFVLSGVMLFIAEVGEPEYKKTTVRENRRERLRVVFENGTESSMYRQSLGIRMGEKDGQAVVPTSVESEFADDVQTGYVYVLRSLSDDPQIADFPDLHKIGFSRGPVEKRIARAEHEPTYLMAPVEIIASYRTYNLKTSALEHLLHKVFAASRLRVSQVAKDGRVYEPSEWFSVPLPVINQAIELIGSGEIVNYSYDAASQRLVERS
ncbi:MULTISPECIES: GIY-YIG nuclease family protein [unclassified Brevibacterium]|uniref:GIY-YIG nuclease family protein n=1 Tax=unclassified Brevibacterium TaxID=2614124 RepID=UPI001E548EBD|nr:MULTISPECIES: GIY-YIG nuclease family protein [unclassified Brevibacterium]MCD1287784.1 helicase [Brevibacterium sp. CCUG 69071]MDK8435107.1 GIY-YIG nuclease family protein [Brevibacterium sp. H-BE7]